MTTPTWTAPSNPFGDFNDPAFILTYGESGWGKSADIIRAFPDAYWIGFQGTDKSAATWDLKVDKDQLLRPRMEEKGQPLNMRTSALFIEAIGQGALPWRPALVVDDISLLADEDEAEVRAWGNDGWDVWRMLKARAIMLRRAARSVRMHVIVNGHEVPIDYAEEGGIPVMDEEGNRKILARGGPKMPSKSMRREFVKVTDTNLRVMPHEDFWEHPFAYVNTNDPSWYMKARHHEVIGIAPMNLGEALRARGFWIPRRAGLEWVDNAADALANKILDKIGTTDPENNRYDLAAEMEETLIQHESRGHVELAVQDGLARWWFRHRRPESRYRRKKRAAAAAAKAPPFTSANAETEPEGDVDAEAQPVSQETTTGKEGSNTAPSNPFTNETENDDG